MTAHNDASPATAQPSPLADSLPVVEFAGFRRWERDRYVPPHRHEALHQFDYFSAGQGTYRIDGKEHDVDPHTMFFVVAGCEHTMTGSERHPLVNLSVKFRHPGIDADFLPPTLAVSDALARDVAALLRAAIGESVAESPERRVLASLRLAEVLVRLRAAWAAMQRGAMDSPHVAAAKRLMLERYADDLSLDDLARAAGVAPAHLCRVFRKETGQTPFQFLRQLRVERAKEGLARSDDRVADIARDAGFHSPRDLNRAFQRMVGASPREYRRRARGPAADGEKRL